MLNTGTAIGVMCNVLPAGWLLPKHIPELHGRALWQGGAWVFAGADVRHGADCDEPPRPGVRARSRSSFTASFTSRPGSSGERAFQKSRDHRGESWPVAAVGR